MCSLSTLGRFSSSLLLRTHRGSPLVFSSSSSFSTSFSFKKQNAEEQQFVSRVNYNLAFHICLNGNIDYIKHNNSTEFVKGASKAIELLTDRYHSGNIEDMEDRLDSQFYSLLRSNPSSTTILPKDFNPLDVIFSWVDSDSRNIIRVVALWRVDHHLCREVNERMGEIRRTMDGDARGNTQDYRDQMEFEIKPLRDKVDRVTQDEIWVGNFVFERFGDLLKIKDVQIKPCSKIFTPYGNYQWKMRAKVSGFVDTNASNKRIMNFIRYDYITNIIFLVSCFYLFFIGPMTFQELPDAPDPLTTTPPKSE